MPDAEDEAKALFFTALDELDRGNYQEAEEGLRGALRLFPDRISVVTNLAVALFRQNRFDEAAEVGERAVALDAENVEGWVVLGCSLAKLNRATEGLEAVDRALAIDPNGVEALVGRGNILRDLQDLPGGLAAFDKALTLAPDSEEALLGRGGILVEQRKYDLAVAAFRKAAAIAPKPSTLAEVVNARMQVSDWEGIEADWAAALAAVESGGDPPRPLLVLSMPSSPERQLAAAQAHTAHHAPKVDPPLWSGQAYDHKRVRIAYVSPDYRNHPMSQLVAGMFEGHDRTRFEIIGISTGPNDDSDMRRRVAGAFDRFVDVRDMSDGEIARTLRDMQSDIVVDLACHTAHSRPGIMARRPAPIQVNYLGYPGTTGSPYHDYIIADATIITPEEHRFYSEAVVTMPDTYWINDSRRHKARRSTTRAEEGLPESGFVFCCFNNNYKITPQVFDIWMRLLGKVEGSVLWLLGDSAAAISNLKRHAEKRGIAPNRLIFAPRLGFDAHLDRHLHADLFLDTQFYNGHTTTADALWAGGPVVTCPGETFASRVAASLVRAANLPELVADSFDDYEALALALARDPARLAATRRKLIANRDICPLFDTKRFTRHLEAAYTVMITQLRNGEKPEAFTVVRYA